jgi:hypothetical protein
VEDLTTLDLELDAEGSLRIISEVRENGSDGELHQGSIYRQQRFTLRDAVLDVISQINEAIRKTPEDASIKGKRYIVLTTDKGSLQHYEQLKLPNQQQSWLRKILDALVEKGHLFKANVNGTQYLIQA